MKAQILILTVLCVFAVACKDNNGINNPQSKSNNRPPQAFGLIGPEDHADSTEILMTFSWTAATDPDGDAVQYDVLLDTMPNARTGFLGNSIEGIPDIIFETD